MTEFRNHEKDIRTKTELIDELRKRMRNIAKDEESFEPKKREWTTLATESEKKARFL
jgi:hypothetical protein